MGFAVSNTIEETKKLGQGDAVKTSPWLRLERNKPMAFIFVKC